MIAFDVNKLRVSVVHLKSVTTALGGSVRVIDEARSGTHEIYKKIAVPFAVARQFIVQHKASGYFKPVVTALLHYGDMVVAMERHPLGGLGVATREDGLTGHYEWEPTFHASIKKLRGIVEHAKWYTDGRCLYSLTNEEGENLSADRKFSTVGAEVISFTKLDLGDCSSIKRMCLRFTASNGASMVSPPFRSTLLTVGSRALESGDSSSMLIDESRQEKIIPDNELQFDRIDKWLNVNLSFVLKAGEEIGKAFGHEAIEPLNLPDLMIKLKTVNLPNVPKSIKETYNVGLQFTHTVAWLMGLMSRTTNLDQFIAVRSLLDYLTTRGIFRANMFKTESVFHAGYNCENIPYVGIEVDKFNFNNGPHTEAALNAHAQARRR